MILFMVVRFGFMTVRLHLIQRRGLLVTILRRMAVQFLPMCMVLIPRWFLMIMYGLQEIMRWPMVVERFTMNQMLRLMRLRFFLEIMRPAVVQLVLMKEQPRYLMVM